MSYLSQSPPLPQTVTTQLLQEELRSGWLGVPRQYQALDAMGALMGAYFIYEGTTGRGPRWLTVSLGAVMVYIHTRRYLYAPQDKEGLYRLMRSLDLSPEEVCGR